MTRRLFEHDRAYIFQNPDKRIVFAIPYERDFTLIGTTDVDYQGDPGDVAISEDEVRYLCSAMGEYFAEPIAPEDVVWSYSGVRPLYDDGKTAAQEATRDFVLELEAPDGAAPLLSIFGGKITTYRHLAEEVLEKLAPWMKGAGAPWTRDSHLPGGDFPVADFERLVGRLREAVPDMEEALARRLLRAYGTSVWSMLDGVASTGDLGRHFGGGLYQREVDHLVAREWASTAEDVLWRRSKLGLRLSDSERASLAEYLEQLAARPDAADVTRSHA